MNNSFNGMIYSPNVKEKLTKNTYLVPGFPEINKNH
jgi:hypothetical protein